MDIFEYKKKNEINKMDLYRKEINLMNMICDGMSEDYIYLKVIIDDIDLFNKFCDRRYKFVNDSNNVYYFHLDLYPIHDSNIKYVYIKCFNNHNENTDTIDEAHIDFDSMEKIDLSDEEKINKMIRGDNSFYLEIHFYSLYMFMNTMAALSVKDVLDALIYNIDYDYDDEDTLNDIKKNLKITEGKLKMIKNIFDI